VCPSNKRAAAWLVFFFLLALAVRMSWGQEPEPAESSPHSASPSLESTLSSLGGKELTELYYLILARQSEQLATDRLNSAIFNEYMLKLFDSLTMQTLESRHTERRASLALIVVKKELASFTQSVESLNAAASESLELARRYKLEARIAEALALLLALGLGASLLF